MINEFPIEENKQLTIGRNNSNDIVIDNLAVSGSHAKIFHHEKGLVLADLKSKNGTFVNQKRVKNHLLKNKDVITIGKHILVYYDVAEVERDETASIEKKEMPPGIAADQTMMMDTEMFRKMLGKKETKDILKTPEACIVFSSGLKGKHSLKKSVTTIGKNDGSDVVIKGLFSFLVGKTAATISKTEEVYQLRYVSGFSKPIVNGKTVKKSIRLNDQDNVKIGPIRFKFQSPKKNKNIHSYNQ